MKKNPMKVALRGANARMSKIARMGRVALMGAMVAASAPLVSSCNDDDNPVNVVDLRITAALPEGYSDVPLDSIAITATNAYTGSASTHYTSASGIASASLEEGVYSFAASVSHAIVRDGALVTANFVATLNNVSISPQSAELTISLLASLINPEGGWLIKEVYFTGSNTVEGNKAYTTNQYVEIYNNSNAVLYADGLAVGQTISNTSNTTWGKALEAGSLNVDEFTYMERLYGIPNTGNGTSYPVSPGHSLLMAALPINHNAIDFPIDLSVADFQYYDNYSHETNVPEVPNLISYYANATSGWIMTVTGNGTFILANIPNLDSVYVQNNTIDAPNASGSGKVYALKVPNANMVDVVATHNSAFKFSPISAALDAGFVEAPASRSSQSLRRKLKEVKDGRSIYQDTNNSTDDFVVGSPKPKVFTE
jgi:hypothetical protein